MTTTEPLTPREKKRLTILLHTADSGSSTQTLRIWFMRSPGCISRAHWWEKEAWKEARKELAFLLRSGCLEKTHKNRRVGWHYRLTDTGRKLMIELLDRTED